LHLRGYALTKDHILSEFHSHWPEDHRSNATQPHHLQLDKTSHNQRIDQK
jgi:hypothetical protein